MAYLDNNKLRQVFFLLIIFLLGFLLFTELKAFLPATLGAFTLYILMDRWMRMLVLRRWPPALAASLLMILSFIVIVIPIGGVIKLLVGRLSISEQQINTAIQAIQHFVEGLETKTGFVILSDKNLSQLGEMAAKELPGILGATFNSLTTIVVMYFILYFMLAEGKKMEAALMEWLPMGRKHRNDLQKEVNTLVISNAVGIPLIAIVQGVVGLAGYLALGVQEPMLWFAITCIAAMLPVVGITVAYIPLALIFFAGGENWKGIALLIYGFLVMGTIDNVFRFVLQKKLGDVHPLITVFGVIIGLQLFGFIGLVFGPLLISVFILLIRIYKLEFLTEMETEQSSVPPGMTAPASDKTSGE